MMITCNTGIIFNITILILTFSQLHFGQSSVNDNLNVMAVPRNGQVDFLCQHNFSKNSKFALMLLKGIEKNQVCKMYANGSDIIFDNSEVLCHLKNSSGTVSFTLSNLDIKHTNHYICVLTNFYPPPYSNSTSSVIYIYVYEPQLERCNIILPLLMWIFMGISIFLLLCCIAILYLWIKKTQQQKCGTRNSENNNENNSVYMPMAPVTVTRFPVRADNGRLQREDIL